MREAKGDPEAKVMGGIATRRERVLMVTRNFPPMVGGMERLLYHVADEFAQTCDVALVAPVGARSRAERAIRFAGCRLRPLPRFLFGATVAATRLAVGFRPDLVFAGSGLVAPIALLAARISGARAVCYLHGLDVVAPHAVYQRLFVPALRHFDLALANSHHTAALAMSIGVPRERVSVLHPGVTLPAAGDRAPFRARVGIPHDVPVLLSVGRLTARKGLVEFVEQALPQVIERHPGTRLVVIGDDPSDALVGASGSVSARVEQAAAKLGLSAHLTMLRGIDDSMLAQAYFGADLLVFPVLERANDVEGFGMVALEAAAHGLPTVAFAVGGVPDAVAAGKSGYLVPAGDYAAFASAITRHLFVAGGNLSSAECRSFASDFAWPMFGERLRRLCLSVAR